MHTRNFRKPLLLIAAILLILSFTGCQEHSDRSFTDIVGIWEAGLMQPTSNDPAIADDPVATDTKSFEVNVRIQETGVNEGLVSVIDMMGTGDGRPFNFSASMTHELFEVPFTFDPETKVLTGEISTDNDDGTSETTSVQLITVPLEDENTFGMNGCIQMELFNADGTSKWITMCTINAVKDVPER